MGQSNLINNEAIEKMKELVLNINFAMMETDVTSKRSHIIPMSTKRVDDDGSIWFLSSKNSQHNANINKDETVQLIYSKPSDMEFLTLYGTATITDNPAIIDELYGKMDDSWFDGKDDPKVSAIKVDPAEGYYYDSKHGKLVTLFKMGIGLATGKKQEISEHGNLVMG